MQPLNLTVRQSATTRFSRCEEMYEFVVVGKGMLGAPAARHLAQRGKNTLLIGSDEPSDYSSHRGVYSSHYDEGRICRVIDPDPIRSELSWLAVAAHKKLQASTGIEFFVENGHLAVGPAVGEGSDYIESLHEADQKYQLGCTRFAAGSMSEHYPYFDPGPQHAGLLQTRLAGYINPRSYINAECAEFENHGGSLVSELVTDIRLVGKKLEVVTSTGIYRTEKVLLATGAFFGYGRLLSREIPLRVGSHTVLLAELDASMAREFGDMPPIIYKPANAEQHCFILPPIKYPDGRVYLKISHPDPSHFFNDTKDLLAWFKTHSDDRVREQLMGMLDDLLPSLRAVSFRSLPCVTSHTPKTHPYIDALTKNVFLLLGGNGYVGKCSIALGEIAAAYAIDGQWIYDQIDREAFRLAA